MSRRKAAPKRDILPDPLFGSEQLAKFINAVMRSGKKSVAEQIVYGALNLVVTHLNKAGKVVKRKDDDDSGEGGSGSQLKPVKGDIHTSDAARQYALAVFRQALDNITPSVEVKSRRVGGSTYQVPVEIRKTRKDALARRWLVEYAAKRSEKTMQQRLANEIIAALEGTGGAVGKRTDVHRMARANQAFAHYRW